jgi:transcriptional regulator with XRE-family HTH domain
MSSLPDINARIAGRVRDLRDAAGVSLETLAANCGVSRSMLSLVERGETSPTAVVLAKIAKGLGVTLASLFDDTAAAPSPLSSARDRVRWKDPQSGYTRRNISPANYPSRIQIVEIEFPAGARVAYENGGPMAAFSQQIWVQEGTLEVTVGSVTHALAKDDCFAMQLDAPVTFHNRTRKRARYLVVVSS